MSDHPMAAPAKPQPVPGWRFSVLYFVSFAALALFGIYGSLYFQRRGLSNAQLGVLYTIPAWMGIFAPLVWGILSDMLQRRRAVLVFMHLMAALTMPTFWFWKGGSFWSVCLLMALFTLFYRTTVPLTDAWVLDHLATWGGDYGRLRSWGSVGFITPLLASMFVLPKEAMSGVRGLLPVFYGFVGFRGIAALYALTLPDYRPKRRVKLDWSSLRVYLHPFAITFFFCVFMSMFLFGPYYTFFSIYLDEQGIADSFKGLFWVAAVGSETILIALSGKLLDRFGEVRVLQMSLTASVVRLFVLGAEPPWPGILAAQMLHAFTFGAFHVTAIRLVHRMTPEPFQATGQTFMGGLRGLGGVAGGLVGGMLAQAFGIARLFHVLGIVALVETVLVSAALAIWREPPGEV